MQELEKRSAEKGVSQPQKAVGSVCRQGRLGAGQLATSHLERHGEGVGQGTLREILEWPS